MTWQEVRAHHPNQWLLLEALESHRAHDQRILDRLAVIAVFEDSSAAWRAYQELHRAAPARELYVLHSSRETPEIEERAWVGIRSAA